MSPLEALLVVAFAVGPTVAAVVYEVRSRRAHQRFQAALEEERMETRLTYLTDDEVTEKRASFSGYPFAKRHR